MIHFPKGGKTRGQNLRYVARSKFLELVELSANSHTQAFHLVQTISGNRTFPKAQMNAYAFGFLTALLRLRTKYNFELEPLLKDLTKTNLDGSKGVFHPENDFYIDEFGNPFRD